MAGLAAARVRNLHFYVRRELSQDVDAKSAQVRVIEDGFAELEDLGNRIRIGDFAPALLGSALGDGFLEVIEDSDGDRIRDGKSLRKGVG